MNYAVHCDAQASLEASGSHPRVVSPDVIRPMVRDVFSTYRSDSRRQEKNRPLLSIEEAAELLRFCMSDLNRTPGQAFQAEGVLQNTSYQVINYTAEHLIKGDQLYVTQYAKSQV